LAIFPSAFPYKRIPINALYGAALQARDVHELAYKVSWWVAMGGPKVDGGHGVSASLRHHDHKQNQRYWAEGGGKKGMGQCR
jgi:hypothetical protein